MSFVQVYTGDGKGKTTAAMGLLLRAVGAGMHTCIFQFMKCGNYCEIETIKSYFPDILVQQLGSGEFINPKQIKNADRERAEKGFAMAREAVISGVYDIVILDEINGAMAMGLIPVEDVLMLMKDKPERTELILTGRDAPSAIINAADLCTEMRMIKHYYQKGIPARRGIEM